MNEYMGIVRVYDIDETHEYEYGNMNHAIEHYNEEIIKGNKATLFRYKDGRLERHQESTNTWDNPKEGVNIMNITREEKKIEAIKRLKTMGIITGAITQFIEDDTVMVSENPYGFLYELSYAQKQLVKEFEAEYKGLVYLANLCNTEFGQLLSLMYVSDHKEEWDMDNAELPEGYAFAYCINLDCPDLSEFGSIAFRPVAGGIVRVG